jgi:hypothetical protein
VKLSPQVRSVGLYVKPLPFRHGESSPRAEQGVAILELPVDSGTCAPWVDIASTDPRTDVSIVKLLQEAQRKCNENKKTEQEIRAIFAEVHKARCVVKAYHIEERRKLLAYLAEFYEDRCVPYDRRLIICPLGTDGKSRLESQGADCQEVASPEEKVQKLAEYQREMQDSTTFLKQKFFYS